MGQALTHLCTLYDQSFPPKPKWGIEDIPDLYGKVAIVTGDSTGLGYETIKALLLKNATVYMASRNKLKAEDAIKRLKKETGKYAKFLQLDLADLKKVKEAAEDFLSHETQLHILFNSGGVYAPPIEQLTADGYDLQFGTNVIGHFLFTKLLLPTMKATAYDSSDNHARIITTASSVHMFWGPGIRYDTLKGGRARDKIGTESLYGQSKYGNIIVARELAKRYGDKGIVSISLNPGNIRTEIQRYVPLWEDRLLDLILYPAPLGALTQLYAGTSPEARNLNGAYLKPWARIGEPRQDVKNPKRAEELWQWLEEQVKCI